MSLVLDYISISKSLLDELIEKLTIEPKSTKFQKQSIHDRYVTAQKKVSALAIQSDPENHKVYLRIPLLFGISFFGQTNDARIFNKSNYIFTGTLRDYQKDVANQTIKLLSTTRGSIIEMRPGKGKTITSIAVGAQIKLLICVLLMLDLCEEWYESYKEFSNANVWRVDHNLLMPDCEVIICLHTRVDKIPKDVRDRVGLLIMDEAHTFCNPSGMKAIHKFQPMYVIACTATFKRPRDSMHLLMEKVVGTNKAFIEDDRMEITGIGIKTPYIAERIAQTHRKGPNWTKLYKSLIYNEERNYMIACVVKILVNYGRKVMVTTLEKEHGAILLNLIGNVMGIKCEKFYGNMKNYQDSPVLVVVIQKCGTGFDEEKKCKTYIKGTPKIDTVFNTVSIADSVRFEQTNGRGARSKNALFITLIDNDNTVKRHWRETAVAFCKINNANYFLIDQSDFLSEDKSYISGSKLEEELLRVYNIRNKLQTPTSSSSTDLGDDLIID